MTEHNISSAQCCRIISLFRSTYFSISLVQKKSLLFFCWLWKQSPHSEAWRSRLSHSFFTYPGYKPYRIFGSVFEPAIHFLWRRKWQPTPVFLPRESCGWRSLVGCCPLGCLESDMTEATWHACMHALEKEMATHSSVLPGESQGRRSLVGCRLWGLRESHTTEAT